MLDKIQSLIAKGTGKLLHLPFLEIHFSLEQTIDGELVKPVTRRRARSWTRNAYNIIAAQMSLTPNSGTSFGAGSLSLARRSDGANQNLTTIRQTSGNAFASPAGASTYGILIGTDNTAFNFDHHNIYALIPNGMGTGQISYGATFTSRSYNAGTKVLTVSVRRYFNNNSGGDIDVGEIVLAQATSGYMYAREALDPKETFLDKAQLQVRYDFSLTYLS